MVSQYILWTPLMSHYHLYPGPSVPLLFPLLPHLVSVSLFSSVLPLSPICSKSYLHSRLNLQKSFLSYIPVLLYVQSISLSISKHSVSTHTYPEDLWIQVIQLLIILYSTSLFHPCLSTWNYLYLVTRSDHFLTVVLIFPTIIHSLYLVSDIDHLTIYSSSWLSYIPKSLLNTLLYISPLQQDPPPSYFLLSCLSSLSFIICLSISCYALFLFPSIHS